MNKHLKPFALLACIAATTAFSSLAFAETGSPDHRPEMKCGEQQGHHRGAFLKRIAKQLGMTEQQKSQAKAILQSSREANKPLVKSLMAERRQMRELILSGTADEAAIRDQSARVAAVQADLAVKRAQEAKQLMALLTPDQVTKLKAIAKKHEGKEGKRFHEEGPAL